jgi:hypothetical protein
MKTINNMKKLILNAAFLVASFATVAQVGVGTTMPSAALDLVSTGSGTDKAMEINSAIGELITVLDNGNVGIGFTEPTDVLQVAGNTQLGDDDTGVSGSLAVNYHANNTGTGGVNIFRSRELGTVLDGDQIYQSIGFAHNGTAHQISNRILTFVDGTPGTTVPSGFRIDLTDDTGSVLSNKFMIRSSGNVGIGITEPEEKLHVSGNTVFMAEGSSTASSGVFSSKFKFGDTTADNGRLMALRNTDRTSPVLTIQNSGTSGDYRVFLEGLIEGNSSVFTLRNYAALLASGEEVGVGFRTHNTGYPISLMQGDNIRLYIQKTTGRVGIGTAAPTEMLHVDGNILATGTITPDYVFESYFDGESSLKPSYKMMSLEEIESFTKENKHLPGVPSAKEVETKGGIVLNRQSEIQLEKIEELYLHTIEQQKQIDALQAQLKLLIATKTK